MKLSWILTLALIMVLLRLLLFDWWSFFRLEYVPNHDMSQAAAFFATSMHSVRLDGDIAWWNPAFDNGYAQYYQAFLSPLAPTPSHVVFIVWAQAVRLLALAGIRIPEYFQYLAITYVVFPLLATVAFAWMCGLVFRSRSAVALAVTVFTLSGIGLWNSAWFYFQESCTLFFLLGGMLAFLKRPTVRSLSVALAAALVQVSSLNYWSVFDSFFVVIFLGTYALVHRNQVCRAARRLRQMASLWPLPATGIAILAGAATALWLALLLSAARDQSAQYLRWGLERLPISEAAENVRPPSYYTTHLVQPDIFAILEAPYDTFQTMHHAGYLGAFLVPLLLVWVLFPWHRRERWLFLATAGVTVVCIGPAVLIRAWEVIPYMDRIRHLFRFYPAFLRVLLVLLGAAGLDRILTRDTPAPRWKLAVLALGTAVSLILIRPALGGLAARFHPPNVEALPRSFVYAAQDGGIAAFAIHPATGALAAVAGSPFPFGGTILGTALDPSGRFLFAVTRDAVAVFAVEATTGALKVPPSTVGAGGTGVQVHPSGRFVMVSGGASDSVSVLAVDPITGSLTAAAGSPFPTGGAGPQSPVVDPSGRFLYVANLGSGTIAAFGIDPATGALARVAGSPFATGAGSGPQGLAVGGRYLYTTHGTSGLVGVYAIDGTTGALSAIPGSPFPAGPDPVAVTVDPTGRFLYAANSGADSVSGFAIDPATGALVAISGSPLSAGTRPQGVITDLSGRFAYVANAGSHDISAYSVDARTGLLTEIAGSLVPTRGNAPRGLTTGRNFTRGDFDRNGLADIVWRHDVSGENVVWRMDGAVLKSGIYTRPPALVDVNWRIAGMGDFTGDRETDILWRHEATGENLVWCMNGYALTRATSLAPADGDWKLAGTGDFNGDGKTDIAWHHRVSGEIALWYMSGSVLQRRNFTDPRAATDPSWKLVGVADFNRDWRPDLLWRHDRSGEVVIWHMADGVLLSATLMNPSALVDVNWKIEAVGDYNSDGRNDVVWRHAVSGQNAVWYLDGANLIGGTFTTPPALADLNWKMVGPH